MNSQIINECAGTDPGIATAEPTLVDATQLDQGPFPLCSLLFRNVPPTRHACQIRN